MRCSNMRRQAGIAETIRWILKQFEIITSRFHYWGIKGTVYRKPGAEHQAPSITIKKVSGLSL